LSFRVTMMAMRAWPREGGSVSDRARTARRARAA
jgi:hypothetical protein